MNCDHDLLLARLMLQAPQKRRRSCRLTGRLTFRRGQSDGASALCYSRTSRFLLPPALAFQSPQDWWPSSGCPTPTLVSSGLLYVTLVIIPVLRQPLLLNDLRCEGRGCAPNEHLPGATLLGGTFIFAV